jgi:hypothetical protein
MTGLYVRTVRSQTVRPKINAKHPRAGFLRLTQVPLYIGWSDVRRSALSQTVLSCPTICRQVRAFSFISFIETGLPFCLRSCFGLRTNAQCTRRARLRTSIKKQLITNIYSALSRTGIGYEAN